MGDIFSNMEITSDQFARIEPFLPVQRGNVSVTNLQVVNAILYGRGKRLQMARIAQALWQLAHDLYANESLG
jgi:hypothetical protein